jgi:hypothetical protein
MSRQLRSYWAVAQLDLAEVLRSRWLLFCVVVGGDARVDGFRIHRHG